MDRVKLAVLDTLSAQDAVPVVIHQKRMTKHWAACCAVITYITETFSATVYANVGIRPQFEDRRHGKNGVDCTQRAQKPAPDPSFVEHAEQERTQRDGGDDPGGEVRRLIGVPGYLDPEQENAEQGRYPAGILSDKRRCGTFGLADGLRHPAGDGQPADAAPGPRQEEERENQQRPANHPAQGDPDIFLGIHRPEEQGDQHKHEADTDEGPRELGKKPACKKSSNLLQP